MLSGQTRYTDHFLFVRGRSWNRILDLVYWDLKILLFLCKFHLILEKPICFGRNYFIEAVIFNVTVWLNTMLFQLYIIQSNLSVKTTYGNSKMWSLFTSGLCKQIKYRWIWSDRRYNWWFLQTGFAILVFVCRWSLTQVLLYLQFDHYQFV